MSSLQTCWNYSEERKSKVGSYEEKTLAVTKRSLIGDLPANGFALPLGWVVFIEAGLKDSHADATLLHILACQDVVDASCFVSLHITGFKSKAHTLEVAVLTEETHLLVEFIFACFHNNRAINIVVRPVRAAGGVQRQVPVGPAHHPVVEVLSEANKTQLIAVKQCSYDRPRHKGWKHASFQ